MHTVLRIALAVVITLACALQCSLGATYYVSTNGNNSNGGTDPVTDAWLTISNAAARAVAGDTVIVGQGEYNEFVTNFVNSGTAASKITYRGTRSGTNWLTIIDPSIIISNNWTYAPEVGAGVYKRTLSWYPGEVTINNQRIGFVHAIGDMRSSIVSTYGADCTMTNGVDLLNMATNAEYPLSSGGTAKAWDAIKVLYGVSNTTTMYLRFQHSNDPNGMMIRAAPNNLTAYGNTFERPAVLLKANNSNITIQDFMIRGAFAAVQLTGSGVRDNMVLSNSLQNGYSRVYIGNGANRNRVQFNECTTAWYGSDDPGAWDGNYTDEKYLNRQYLYVFSKYIMGENTSFDSGVNLDIAGPSNIISGNHVFKGLGTAIEISGDVDAPTMGTMIYSNSVEQHPSSGLHLSSGHTYTYVYGNSMSDNSLNTRWQFFNAAGETSRVVYFFRNTLREPSDVGKQIYIHYGVGGGGYRPEVWFYHNSLDGGSCGLDISTYAETEGGATNLIMLNNLFSDVPYYRAWSDIVSNWIVGEFDYNIITTPMPSYHPPLWLSGNCVTNTINEWTNGVPASFRLNTNSIAIDRGLDIPVSYPTLPSDGTVKAGSAWDIGAMEYSDTAQSIPRGSISFRGKIKLQ